MNLLLWRHADAEEGWPDLQRKLSAKGERQAQHVAQWIVRHVPADWRLACSPARRCQQTAQALLDLTGRPLRVDERLSTRASSQDLLSVVHALLAEQAAEQVASPKFSPNRLHAEQATLLLVGHQPTLGQLAAWLLSGEEAAWTVKKGALWWFSCPNNVDLTAHRFLPAHEDIELHAVYAPDFGS